MYSNKNVLFIFTLLTFLLKLPFTTTISNKTIYIIMNNRIVNLFGFTTFESKIEAFVDSAVHFGIKLLVAVAILAVGLWLVKKITKSVKKVMEVKNVDPSLRTFLSSLISILLKMLVIIIVLATVGIEMTSIIAILGAASLAIGMALSGTLQNFSGGVVILLFKPFEVGDLIETQSGHMGYVQGIMIFTTRMRTFDNKIIYLPNGALANGVITNHTKEKRRRVDEIFGISYGDDIKVARELMIRILTADERVHKDPMPLVRIRNLSESSVDIQVRFWVNFENYYRIKYEIREIVYNEFPKHGLSFAYPHMDVHLDQEVSS